MSNPIVRTLTRTAKAVFALAIIALILWKKVDLRELEGRLRGIDARLFSITALSYGVLLALLARRWKVFVDVQGIRARYGSLLRFALIGQFFNNIMPGSMGGDIVKAWYCAKADPLRKEGAVSSVLADRIMGFLSLFAIGFVGLAANAGTRGLRQASAIFLAMFVAISAGIAILYSRGLLARLPFAGRIVARMPFRENVRRLYDALYIYRSHPRRLAMAFGISCGMQFGFILVTLAAARALGMAGVHYRHLLLLTPLIGTIAAAPVTPSGWGTMEWAFVYFFPALGVTAEQALALDLVMRIIVIAWGVAGGLVYALHGWGGGAAETPG